MNVFHGLLYKLLLEKKKILPLFFFHRDLHAVYTPRFINKIYFSLGCRSLDFDVTCVKYSKRSAVSSG